MRQRFPILARVLVLAPMLSGLALIPSGQAGFAPAGSDSVVVAASGGNHGASPEEIRALVDRVTANQHHNDATLWEYERLERQVVRKSGKDKRVPEEKTFRVVPTGTGTLRLLVKEKGQPVEPEFYRQELRDLEQALMQTLNPNEPDQKRRVEKWVKRNRERAEMVDAVRNAFHFTWVGREAREGRTLIKLDLAPNPAFKPRSRSTELLAHVHATLWIDEAAGQLARAEAEIVRDIAVGGGVLGKVYRGGRFVMEQREVAAGVWLASRFEYDFKGRKFLFGFEVNELTELSRYRRIGPPKEALAAIRRELAGGQAATADPDRDVGV